MSITAILPVFNEEKRLEATLKTLMWCDEIIIVDKNSTDNTRNIANKYSAKVFILDNTAFNTDDIDIFIENCTSEWMLTFTASDIIHPKLARSIKEITDNIAFEFDVIHIPYHRIVLGIDSKRSPWHSELHPAVFRKSVFQLNRNGVHDAVKFTSKKHFKMGKSEKYCVYHLTHENLDSMMERHTRYWKAEALSPNTNLKQSFKEVLSAIKLVLLKRKTFLMGWDGIMLSFAFVTYYMMSFVYKWENQRSKSTSNYDILKKEIQNSWEREIF